MNDDRFSSGGVIAAECTLTQAALIDIWKQILWVPDLEAHDNFIDLGGHSLTATRCINRIRVLFKVDVPLDAFFMDPGDIASIADLIDNALNGPGLDGRDEALRPVLYPGHRASSTDGRDRDGRCGRAAIGSRAFRMRGRAR